MRIFRETTGHNPGICLTKDLIYRAGNQRLWTILARNPELFPLTELGKWDLNNPTHWWVLYNQGLITENDLTYLEEIEKYAFTEVAKPKGLRRALLQKYREEIDIKTKSVLTEEE